MKTKWHKMSDYQPIEWGTYLTWSKNYGFSILDFQLKDGGLDGRKAGNFYDPDNDGSFALNHMVTHWTCLKAPK